MMMEVKAVEVSRNLRSCKIAGDLVRLMISHPRIEEMIAYLVGYSWTWGGKNVSGLLEFFHNGFGLGF